MEQIFSLKKKCHSCDIEKPLTEFYKFKYGKDGLQTECKICNRQRVYEWNKKNPEKAKLRARIRYLNSRPLMELKAVAA